MTNSDSVCADVAPKLVLWLVTVFILFLVLMAYGTLPQENTTVNKDQSIFKVGYKCESFEVVDVLEEDLSRMFVIEHYDDKSRNVVKSDYDLVGLCFGLAPMR